MTTDSTRDLKQNKKRPSPSRDWSNEGDVAYYGAQWIGAVVFYLLRADRSREFDEFLSDGYTFRNAFVGWLVQMIGVALIVLVLFNQL